MIVKTRGVVLNYLSFRERSIIARIYTEKYGCLSFVVNNVRSQKAQNKIAYFQPLNLLELVIYYKPDRNINRISEYKSLLLWHQADIKKQAILLFLSEVLYKLLKNEHTEDPELFDILCKGFSTFFQSQTMHNFHLQLLIKLIPKLGFSVPQAKEMITKIENDDEKIAVENFVETLESSDWETPFEANSRLRFLTLQIILSYFEHQIHHFGKIQSFDILRQIFYPS